MYIWYTCVNKNKRGGIKMMTKSILMKRAWTIANKLEGDLRARLSYALKKAWEIAKKLEKKVTAKTSTLSEVIRNVKDNHKDFFFGKGNWKMISNKYLKFKRIINEENIIVITNNIKEIKNSLALVVDNNKAVFLKEWQVESVYNYDEGIRAFAVKLNKKYFKVYTFRNDFDNFDFDKEDSFESLKELAEVQQREDLKFSLR